MLTDLFISRGTPAYIRSDNGPEFVATAVKAWITELGAKPAYIEPGSPWENGYVESFNGKFRDELLACEAFNTLAEAKRPDRAMARALQHRAAAQLAGLPAASTRGRPVENATSRSSASSGGISRGVRHHADELRFHPDHSMGAGHLVVFNHKGGVSKTTSAYNIAWMMSRKHRVMLVDADPQCNLTGLILGDAFEKYYTEPQTREHNIKDGVASAFGGKPIAIRAVNGITIPRAENLFLLAGHANLSEYDAALTFAQTSNNAIATLQNLPGAFSRLLKLTEKPMR